MKQSSVLFKYTQPKIGIISQRGRPKYPTLKFFLFATEATNMTFRTTEAAIPIKIE